MANDGDDGQPNMLIITHPEPGKLNSTQLSCGAAAGSVASAAAFIVAVQLKLTRTKPNCNIAPSLRPYTARDVDVDVDEDADGASARAELNPTQPPPPLAAPPQK